MTGENFFREVLEGSVGHRIKKFMSPEMRTAFEEKAPELFEGIIHLVSLGAVTLTSIKQDGNDSKLSLAYGGLRMTAEVPLDNRHGFKISREATADYQAESKQHPSSNATLGYKELCDWIAEEAVKPGADVPANRLKAQPVAAYVA